MHNFYFVVPNGIIKENELPANVGLMIYYPESGTLRVKKKAPYLKTEVSSDMILHIMFWKFDKYNRPKSRQEHLDDIKAKVESRDYGSEIANKIRQLERKLKSNKYDNRWNDFCKEFEERFGYEPTVYEIQDLIPDDIESVKDLHMIKHSINQLHERLNRKKVK